MRLIPNWEFCKKDVDMAGSWAYKRQHFHLMLESGALEKGAVSFSIQDGKDGSRAGVVRCCNQLSSFESD